MERTIEYEGQRWRVSVHPAPFSGDQASGLELVFMEERGDRYLTSPVGPELLRLLSQDALDVDERLLQGALRVALKAGSGGIDDVA